MGNSVGNGSQDASSSPHALAAHNDEIGSNLVGVANDDICRVPYGCMYLHIKIFDAFGHILEHPLRGMSQVRLT